jgi:hypothetical protein
MWKSHSEDKKVWKSRFVFTSAENVPSWAISHARIARLGGVTHFCGPRLHATFFSYPTSEIFVLLPGTQMCVPRPHAIIKGYVSRLLGHMHERKCAAAVLKGLKSL